MKRSLNGDNAEKTNSRANGLTGVSTSMTAADEIERRIQKLQCEMQSEGMDGLFILQRVDLLYFSGTAQNGFLFIPAEGAPILLVKKYLPRAMAESPLKNIIQIQSVKDIPGHIVQYYGKVPHRMALEWDVMPVREFHFFRRIFADSKCLDGSPLIHAVRAIKSDWEIIQIEKATQQSARAFDYIQNNLMPGHTRLELAGMVENFTRAAGHGGRFRIRDYQKKGFTAQTLLQSGAGTIEPPCFPEVSQGTALLVKTEKKVKYGDSFPMESRFVLNGYHVDEARTFAMGSLKGEAAGVSRSVLDLYNELLVGLRPGFEIGEWIKRVKKKTRPFYSSLSITGHGIGLELIEPPFIGPESKQMLERGMVLAVGVETGMDSPLRAGMKSVVLVTQKGHRTLSRVPACVLTCPC